MPITASIDVALIDKARLKQITRKNGKEAKFLDLILVETPNSEYGDYIVKQSTSKEEREANVQMPILGNAKKLQSKAKPAHTGGAQKDDVPF